MSNDTVPAAAEGIPMPRRNFIRGAVLALALPAPAVAAPPRDELGLMIEKCRQLADHAEELDKASFDIFHRGDRPDDPHVLAKEFPRYCWPMRHTAYHNRSKIDECVDHRIAERRQFYAWCAEGQEEGMLDWQIERLAQNVADAEQDRIRLHRLFDERKARYDDWAVSSGYRAADDAVEKNWKEFFEIQDKILAFPCTTVFELVTKAAYIIAEWGDDFQPERQHHFILEVAQFSKRGEAA